MNPFVCLSDYSLVSIVLYIYFLFISIYLDTFVLIDLYLFIPFPIYSFRGCVDFEIYIYSSLLNWYRIGCIFDSGCVLFNEVIFYVF